LNIPQTKQLATMTTAADSNQPTRVAKVAVQIFSAIYASIHLVSSIYWVFFVCVFRTNCFLVGCDFRGWIGGRLCLCRRTNIHRIWRVPLYIQVM
jgi:hypothetical protein